MRIIDKVSVEDTDYIVIDNLSPEELEIAKKKLIENHIERALCELTYDISDKISEMCSSRLFFIQIKNLLVLCGVYYVHDKRYKIRKDIYRTHEVYDYVLYCEAEGFYIVRGCSAPVLNKDSAKCVCPSIYHRSKEKDVPQLLDYGKTYPASEFLQTFVVHNLIRHKSEIDTRIDITVIANTSIRKKICDAISFVDLPLTEGHFIYSKEIDYIRRVVKGNLENCFSGESIEICCMGAYAFPYNSATTLSWVMRDAVNKAFRTSDAQCYYFYVAKTETFAFDEIMKCVAKYGNSKQIKNLFEEDSSVNYQLCFSKETPRDVIGFVYGVIEKSKVLYPQIFGCPIHEVVEVLCRDCVNKPYATPQNSIDECSAHNIIDYFKRKYGDLTNSEIVHLLVKAYGAYAVANQHGKSNMYYYGESLRCEYLPRSMEALVGETINGHYVQKLEKSNLQTTWKSEILLYRLVYTYYPDAIMHYKAKWLGYQHIDIYIPCLKIGIEYQGEQHYRAIDFFGGEMGFDDRQFLDEQKRRICSENDILLLEWPYTLTITAINMLKLLFEHGITSIPSPDPFNLPTYVEESVPEEKAAIQIFQFSLDGEFIARYANCIEASTISGISYKSIYKAVCGYNKTAEGYQWKRLLANQQVENIEPIKKAQGSNVSLPVYQVTLDGEIIAEYESISKAEKATGINSKSIRAVVTGIQRTAGGYLWMRKEAEN